MHKIKFTSVGNGPLANLVGPTFYITNEDGGRSTFASTMDVIHAFLGELILDGDTNSDEADVVENQIREMGTCESLAELRQRYHQLTSQYASEYGFEICADSDCADTTTTRQIPLHGWVTHKGEKITTATNPIGDFETLYGSCVNAVNSRMMITNDALAILQQSSKLVLTREELERAAATTIRTVSIFFVSSVQVD